MKATCARRGPIRFLLWGAMILPASAQGPAAPDRADADAPPAADRWRLTFADEFDAPAGTGVDADKWGFDIGGGGFGNGELQTYTDRPENARHDGAGHLIIEARAETLTGPDGIERDYTSARLLTRGRFSQRYGRIEARLKLPEGQGLWPAFWMLGDSIGAVGWPRCGEIDIMENLGREPRLIHGTIHLPSNHAGNGLAGTLELPEGQTASDRFRVYAVEWTPEGITWSVDDTVYHVRRAEDLPGVPWPFDAPHFIIMNVAVGGHWPGSPDATTAFPQRMLVDYVRVYEDTTLVVDEEALSRRAAERAGWRPDPPPATFVAAPRVDLPGMILTANYVEGGAGVGYRDADATNHGGGYRPGEGVDLGGCSHPDAEYAVGWTAAGEWLQYDVAVAEAGTYRVEALVACDGPGGHMLLRQFSGDHSRARFAIPDTGGWSNWEWIDAGTIEILGAGHMRMQLVMLHGSGPEEQGHVGNIAALRLTPAESSPSDP